jgi:arylsulfatase A-like enzyme
LVKRPGRSRLSLLCVLSASGAWLGCPTVPKEIVYDLARRAAVAERWSSRDVLLFGTPAAEPHQAEGFHREAGGGTGETFLWSKQEAEVALAWPKPEPRAAVLELAPYPKAKDKSLRVFLNGAPVGAFRLNDSRHRYLLSLPQRDQRAGENRLRFVFAASASPVDDDPASLDRRQLAAAFYSLVVGPASDAGLEDLLGRDAPGPFSVAGAGGVPSLTLVGPSVARFAVRLPAGAELRFTPELHRAARAAAGSAAVRVTVENAERSGGEQTVWSRRIDGADGPTGEVGVDLAGAPGDVVRVSFQVAPARGERFAWVVLTAPRILGRSVADPLGPSPPSPADDARAEPLRKVVAGSNVLLVILDAARAANVGAYGYARPTTPQLDRMASEGVLFENAFTPAVYTLGAMSSLWTSQYPDRHHSEVSFSARLPRDRLTLAELLSAQGVFTAAFVANAVAGAGFGFDRGFTEFNEVFRTLGSRGDVFRKALPPWLAAHRDRRLFAYVHFREPHFPYDPPPPFDTRFGPDGPIPRAARRDQAWFREINQGRRPLSAEEREHLVRLYDGNLAFADQELGAIRAAFEKAGLWDRTVVIVAADHGEALFEHGWIGHNVQLFEESIHIPLIVRFPAGRGPAGKRVGALVDLLDLAPTIADLFGVLGHGGSREAFQGRSLLPVIAGAPGKPAVLARTVWDRPRYALRDERFKFHYDTRSGQERLTGLAADPGETRDVAPDQPVRAAYYRQALHDWTLSLAGRPPASEQARLTREQCENLRTLGYLAPECR